MKFTSIHRGAQSCGLNRQTFLVEAARRRMRVAELDGKPIFRLEDVEALRTELTTSKSEPRA